MPVLPQPMPRPTQQPKSVYACVLRLIFAERAQAARSDASSTGTNTEKPAEMPLPVRRGHRKALLQRNNAALGAAFSHPALQNMDLRRFEAISSPPPRASRAGAS